MVPLRTFRVEPGRSLELTGATTWARRHRNGTCEQGHGTRPTPVRRRSAGHLRTAPTPRHHAGGPSAWAAVPPARRMGPRRHRSPHDNRRRHGPRRARTSPRARQRPPDGARADGDRVVYSTDSRPAPIEIPIPHRSQFAYMSTVSCLVTVVPKGWATFALKMGSAFRCVTNHCSESVPQNELLK